MKYPKHEVYENLYKRYFVKGVNYLISEADVKNSDVILDICGGGGRLSKELLNYCKNITLLDKEIDMIDNKLSKLGVKIINNSIESFVVNNTQKYTKVFCEQAINYWLLYVDMAKLASIFEKDGLFVFNTFSKKPSKTPMIKEYVLENKNFVEVSYLVDDIVYHVQICEGMEPHTTKFNWISKEKFLEILSPYFSVNIKDDGKSAIYVCRKK